MNALDFWRGHTSPLSIFDDLEAFGNTRLRRVFTPVYDVIAKESGYEIIFDIPGVKEEDISIETQDDQLTVKGKRDVPELNKNEKYVTSSRSYGEFSQTFSLPAGSSEGEIQAEFSNGVLKVIVPKAKEKLARTIELRKLK